MRFLAVKNWRTFQHYSDRRPPWIKLYINLLDDLEFAELSESAQIALVRVWLLTARLGHPLPNNPKLIFQRASVAPRRLAELIAAGWLRATDDASEDATSDDSKTDSALTRASARSREGEGEREGDTPSPAARLAGFRHAMDWTPEQCAAADAYANEHRDPEAFYRALSKLGTPITGNGFGWPIVGQALAEMRANNADWHVKLCAAYCRRIAQGDLPDTPTPPHRARGNARRARNLTVLAAHAAEVQHG